MIRGDGNRFSIDGAITMDNANAILKEGLEKFAQATEIDLSALTEVDSAAVSLLLEWRRTNPGLCFAACNDNLKSLLILYDVTDLIQ